MLQTAVDQGTLHNLGVAQHVIITAGDHAHHGAARREVHLSQTCHRQRTGGLRDDAFVLIQVQHVRAHRTFIHVSEMNPALVLFHDLVVNITNALHGGTINERVHVLQRDRLPRFHRRRHRRRSGRFQSHNGSAWRHISQVGSDTGNEPATADRHKDVV